MLGASATVLLIVGLLRVFYFEKGATYYLSSHAFLTKFSVFILVAIDVGGADHRIPVMAQGGAGRAGADGERQEAQDRPLDPAYELIGIVVILACAALMAKGGWVLT